ncbi:MAG: hypothetical protein RLZZ400_800 [Actinomycetota bacterium]|jgi:uncharacterized protein YdhG (YjbR/CyaY superfamily)
MSAAEIDAYLAKVEEPKRSTLQAVRQSILEVIPEAEQCISYGMPAFRVDGKVLAGFAAFKNHCAYLPHSGSVISEIPELNEYTSTQGSLHFPVDKPLSKKLIKLLIEVRSQQAFGR